MTDADLHTLSCRVEETILLYGMRGMNQLAPHLQSGWVLRAAQYLLSKDAPVLLATGFYIAAAQAPETDGPVGSVHIGKALTKLGRECVYVSEPEYEEVIRATAGTSIAYYPFDIADRATSCDVADELRSRYDSMQLVCVERAGIQPDGTYRNMRWLDVTKHTAMIDVMFEDGDSICIGDGGNELGMGSLAVPIVRELGLRSAPVVCARHLVLATTSNWGAYGLITMCSALTGHSLLPEPDEVADAVRRCVGAGAVDGVSGAPEPLVDGFSLEVNIEIVDRLRDLLQEHAPSR